MNPLVHCTDTAALAFCGGLFALLVWLQTHPSRRQREVSLQSADLRDWDWRQ